MKSFSLAVIWCVRLTCALPLQFKLLSNLVSCILLSFCSWLFPFAGDHVTYTFQSRFAAVAALICVLICTVWIVLFWLRLSLSCVLLFCVVATAALFAYSFWIARISRLRFALVLASRFWSVGFVYSSHWIFLVQLLFSYTFWIVFTVSLCCNFCQLMRFMFIPFAAALFMVLALDLHFPFWCLALLCIWNYVLQLFIACTGSRVVWMYCILNCFSFTFQHLFVLSVRHVYWWLGNRHGLNGFGFIG